MYRDITAKILLYFLPIPFCPVVSFAKHLAVVLFSLVSANAEGSFTNPQLVLDPNASSTLMSTTLGGSGDYLVFANPSPEPIQIELTVLDE